MKIICLVTMYNRPRISEIFLTGMRRLGIEVFASVSDRFSNDICNKFGIQCILEPNLPIGKKLNKTLESIMHKDWTHLMISGDDDLYLNEILDIYDTYKDEPAIGFKTLYFIEPSSQRAMRFEYEADITIGAGRLLRRDVVEKVLQIKKGLWDRYLNKGLDASMTRNLNFIGVTARCIPLDKPLIIDVKSKQNIWSFDRIHDFKKTVNIIEPQSYDSVVGLLSDKEKLLISKLPK